MGFPSIERVLDSKSALSSFPSILKDKMALFGKTISFTKPEQLKWYRCEPAESAIAKELVELIGPAACALTPVPCFSDPQMMLQSQTLTFNIYEIDAVQFNMGKKRGTEERKY